MTAESVTAQSSGNTNPSPVFRARAFQFTLNEIGSYEDFRDIFKTLKSCDYFISCKEKAPTTGHEHIHVYVHFTSSYKLSQKILNFKAHVEICKGSPQQNIDYIKKDGNVLDEWGQAPHQGFHTVAELKQCQEPDELNWNEYNTWLKIKNAPKKVSLKSWNKDVKIWYIWGPSGSGKSTMAEKILRDEGFDEFEEVKHTHEFWNGVIDGKGACVYDDWRDSHMTASEFINFIDYRSHNLNIKGGAVRNEYNLIIITTVQDPDSIYGCLQGEPREQWRRRIKTVHINGPPINETI